MLDKLLGALLPAVITIVLGYFAARHHDFKQEDVPVLNRMVIGYALPLSLFVGVVQADRSELLKALPLMVILAVAIMGTYTAIFLLGRFVLRYGAGICAIGALAASAPSSAFVGAAVLGYFYGNGADIPIAISSIVIVLTLVPVTIITLSLETGGSRLVRHGTANRRLTHHRHGPTPLPPTELSMRSNSRLCGYRCSASSWCCLMFPSPRCLPTRLISWVRRRLASHCSRRASSSPATR